MGNREYELSNDQYAIILEASKPVPLIALHCGPIMSPQERANDAWAKVGRDLGFDPMTVKPSAKGERFFWATPTQEPTDDD